MAAKRMKLRDKGSRKMNTENYRGSELFSYVHTEASTHPLSQDHNQYKKFPGKSHTSLALT